MKCRIFFIAVSFVLLFNISAALEFTADAQSYVKEDTITLTGSCETNFSLLVESDGRQLYEGNLECTDNRFIFSYKTSMLDPEGILTFTAKDQTAIFSREAYLAHKPESAYFLIKFLSPSPGKQSRKTDLKVTVRIADAGEAISDANVFFWSTTGERLNLDNLGSGIYSLNYEIPRDVEIPEDANSASWKLTVVAQRKTASGNFGGENSQDIEIIPATLTMEIIEPKVRTFNLGDAVPLAVKVTYANGKPLIDPTVLAVVSGKTITLEQTEDNTYRTAYALSGGDAASLIIEIIASDDSGNTSKTEIGLVTTGWLNWFISSNIIYIILAVILIVAAFVYARRKIQSKFALVRLTKEQAHLKSLVTAVQNDYFKKGKISRQYYNSALSDYTAKINELGNKIEHLKQKMKNPKSKQKQAPK